MFSSRSFTVSSLMFKFLIHFELIIAYVVRQGSNFIVLHVDIQFSQHHLLKRLSFLIVYSWHPCQKLVVWGFPGGAVVENLPANAGEPGSSPGLGRSHMPRSDQAREPQLLSLRVWSLCSATGEAATVRGPRTAMKSGPRSSQLEKALAQKQRPNTAKNKYK